MTIKVNHHGPFVEDDDERRAYVSKEDAKTLAVWYKLGFTIPQVIVLCIVSAITASIVAQFLIIR